MMIIDRFEGDMAVIEYNGYTFDIPKVLLPHKAQEGDVIKIVVDEEATQEKKKEIDDLADDLFK